MTPKDAERALRLLDKIETREEWMVSALVQEKWALLRDSPQQAEKHDQRRIKHAEKLEELRSDLRGILSAAAKRPE